MDKSIGYWTEKLIGLVIGLIAGYLVFKSLDFNSVLLKDKYYDITVKVSSSIFGFLLTILALLVNSSNKTISEIRESKLYERLILNNKRAVFLMFFLLVSSLFIFLIVDSNIDFQTLSNNEWIIYKILVSIHSFMNVWGAINTFIFVRIFYKIILLSAKLN